MADAQKIREEFAKIVPDYQDVLQFQADGELIVNDIEKKIGLSKKGTYSWFLLGASACEKDRHLFCKPQHAGIK